MSEQNTLTMYKDACNREAQANAEILRLRSIIEGLECDCDGLIIPCQSQICRAKQEARKIKEGV